MGSGSIETRTNNENNGKQWGQKQWGPKTMQNNGVQNNAKQWGQVRLKPENP